MKSKFPNLSCAQCGSNRFKFPKSATELVKCGDCGHPVASLGELQEQVAKGEEAAETREQRHLRHAKEVAESHAQLRKSVAETDRRIVASDEMIKRHRQEDKDGGD